MGSYNRYDWVQSLMNKIGGMLRQAVYPTTSPHGAGLTVRLDMVDTKENYERREAGDKLVSHTKWWAAGWRASASPFPLTIGQGVIHEAGHMVTQLPDLYAYGIAKNKIFLRDEEGNFYQGGPLIPGSTRGGIQGCRINGRVPCGSGYGSLMGPCRLLFDEANAGVIRHLSQTRHLSNLFEQPLKRFIPT